MEVNVITSFDVSLELIAGGKARAAENHHRLFPLCHSTGLHKDFSENPRISVRNSPELLDPRSALVGERADGPHQTPQSMENLTPAPSTACAILGIAFLVLSLNHFPSFPPFPRAVLEQTSR